MSAFECSGRDCRAPIVFERACLEHADEYNRDLFFADLSVSRTLTGLSGATLGSETWRKIVAALTPSDRIDAELIDLSEVRFEATLQIPRGRIGQLLLNQTEITGDVQIEHLELSDLFGMALRVGGDLQIGSTFVAGQTFLPDISVAGDVTGSNNSFAGSVSLVRARVTGAMRFQVSAPDLDLGSSRIQGGGDIRFRGDRINLRYADLSGPLLLSSSGSFTENAAQPTRPRLVSVESANVAGLTIAELDLRHCRFAGAHNLSNARIEDSCDLVYTPSGWTRGGRRIPIPVRHSRRRVILEEIEFRARLLPKSAWPGLLDQNAQLSPLQPSQIASIYRALRKGREDARDEPGAADFYYGEMEMRRQRPLSTGADQSVVSGVERAVVSAYWAVSGYSLRAWRALSALCLLIATSSLSIMIRWPQALPSASDDFTFLLNATWMSLGAIALRTIPPGSPPGLVRLLTCLAVLGPLLVAFALFAVRGRVKR